MGRTLIDLTGKRFGMLTVISFDHDTGSRKYWNCKCDCGGERVVSGDHLRNEDITDCGCYRRHIAKHQKHGMCNSRIYTIWSLMKERCFNSKRKEYPNYGGRNITVCDEWLDSNNFISWALSNGYADDLTLDRIDNDGNYCPENCKWVSRKEQQNNRRTNRYITYNNETKTLAQWADYYNLPYYLLKNRLDKLGWSFERAISEPIHLAMSHKKKGGQVDGGICI